MICGVTIGGMLTVLLFNLFREIFETVLSFLPSFLPSSESESSAMMHISALAYVLKEVYTFKSLFFFSLSFFSLFSYLSNLALERFYKRSCFIFSINWELMPRSSAGKSGSGDLRAGSIFILLWFLLKSEGDPYSCK